MKTIHIETKNKGLIKKLWPLLEKDGKFHFFYEPELVIRISKKKVLRAVKNYLEKNSFEYFLLPDEIESMVKGMYVRSKNEDVEIDKIFDKYLHPFLESGKITQDQYLTVLKAWVEHTLENYPDAKLSTYREKINKIVDQI